MDALVLNLSQPPFTPPPTSTLLTLFKQLLKCHHFKGGAHTTLFKIEASLLYPKAHIISFTPLLFYHFKISILIIQVHDKIFVGRLVVFSCWKANYWDRDWPSHTIALEHCPTHIGCSWLFVGQKKNVLRICLETKVERKLTVFPTLSPPWFYSLLAVWPLSLLGRSVPAVCNKNVYSYHSLHLQYPVIQ